MTCTRGLRICLSILAFIGCTTNTDQWTESERKLELDRNRVEAEFEKAIKGLATRYGATQDWDKSLTLEPVFTIDLQRALQAADGRPIVVKGNLTDIAFDDSEARYVATFEPRNTSQYSFVFGDDGQMYIGPRYRSVIASLIYRLECTERDADRLLAGPRLSYGARQFALVVTISSVHKIGFRIGIDHSDEVAELSVEHPDEFIARGSLLDFVEAPTAAVESNFAVTGNGLPIPRRPPD